MATTCNSVKFDVEMVNRFAQYLNYSKKEIEVLKKAANDGIIQRDRLAEVATSAVSGLAIMSIVGQDFSDGSDKKTSVSSVRMNKVNGKHWTHSFKITNTQTKTGALRVSAYNTLTGEWHFFFIPKHAYGNNKIVEIIIERTQGVDDPKFDGKPNRNYKYWEYECASFEEMCSMR